MDTKAFATLGVTLFVAFAGFAFAYWNNLRLSLRKDRLDRVSQQLGELYGPLLAINTTKEATWDLFRERYRPGYQYFWEAGEEPPSEDEAKAWRLWMTEVFMPLNRQMVDVIRSRADLLDDAEIPKPLLDVCAHVASYEVVLKRWEAGDFTENVALANFPRKDELQFLSDRFIRLKREQQKLLSRRPSSAAP